MDQLRNQRRHIRRCSWLCCRGCRNRSRGRAAATTTLERCINPHHQGFVEAMSCRLLAPRKKSLEHVWARIAKLLWIAWQFQQIRHRTFHALPDLVVLCLAVIHQGVLALNGKATTCVCVKVCSDDDRSPSFESGLCWIQAAELACSKVDKYISFGMQVASWRRKRSPATVVHVSNYCGELLLLTTLWRYLIRHSL